MADMLKFRKGTLAQINATDPVAGTVYIAKDEKAMYVDIANGESGRIRIGDLIRVASINKIEPPFSTTSLYYVEDNNALLGYDGKNWKQINGTEELVTRIAAVESDVSALKGTVGNTNSGLIKDVADLKTAVGNTNSGLVKDVADNASDIEDLKKAINMGTDGTSGGIGGTVAQLVKDLEQAEKDIDALEGTVAGHTSALNILQGDANTSGSVAEAKAAADAAAILAGQKVTMAEVEAKDYATKEQAQGYADAKDAAIEAAANAAAAAKATADAAVTKNAFESFKTENTTAISNAAAGAVEDANEYTDGQITAEIVRADGKYATKTALDATDGVVAGHTQAISSINAVLESVVTKTELESKNYATTTQVATAKSEAITAAAQDAATKYATTGALATTNEAVSAARGRADDAYTLASGKTTTDEVRVQIEAYGYATTTQVATAKSEAIAAAKTAGDKDYAAKSLEQTVAGISGTIGSAADGLIKDIADNAAAAAKAQDDINAWKEAHKDDYTNAQIDNAVADAKKAGTDAGVQAETNRQVIAALKGAVDKLDGTVGTEGSVKKQIKDAVDAAKVALSAEIDADIRAANAMEYIATIESAEDLPTTAKNGATYVVGATFGNYAAGDMLIAQGDEDNDTGLITNPAWAHVKSGYDASLDQQLTGADNKIKLSNGIRNIPDAAGAITFTATGSASVSVANNTVTVGMVWEDFANKP